MSVKVTFEFENAEAAIVALGKIAGVTPAAAPQPAAEKKERKPRADAGQPRGPYKKGEQAPEPNAGASAGGGTGPVAAGNSAPVTTDPSKAAEQAANSTSTTTAAPGAAAQLAAASTTASAPVAAPKPEDVQGTLEKLFAAKGFDVCEQVLSRFGVKRAKDLLPEQRAEFIAKADRVIAGEAV